MGALLANQHDYGTLGRSRCSASDKLQRKIVEQSIDKYLNFTDRKNLVSGMESTVAPTSKDMAYFYLGGDDCKHKNVSPGDDRFLKRLPQLISQRKLEAEARDAAAKAAAAAKKTGNTNDGSYSGSGSTNGGSAGSGTNSGSGSTGGSGASSGTAGEEPKESSPVPAPTNKTGTYIAIGAGALILVGTVLALAK